MPQGYSLDRESILKLRGDHHDLERQLKELREQLNRQLGRDSRGGREDEVIAKVTAEITGRYTNDDDNEVLGSGTAEIFHNGMENASELTTSSRSVTVKNLTTSTIDVDEYIHLTRHFATGDWMAQAAGSETSISTGSTIVEVRLLEDMSATTAFKASADLFTINRVGLSGPVTVVDYDDLFPYALGPVTGIRPGARGFATINGDDEYVLIYSEVIARMIHFRVYTSGGFDECDPTFVGELLADGWMDGQNPGDFNSRVTITNPLTHCGAGDQRMFQADRLDLGFARWSDTEGKYLCIQIECPDLECEACP